MASSWPRRRFGRSRRARRRGSLQNTGRGCATIEVVYVVESVYDAFVQKISDLGRGVRVGGDDNAQLGPVLDPPSSRSMAGFRTTCTTQDAVGGRWRPCWYTTPALMVLHADGAG